MVYNGSRNICEWLLLSGGWHTSVAWEILFCRGFLLVLTGFWLGVGGGRGYHSIAFRHFPDFLRS